jgi:hypothetical protein
MSPRQRWTLVLVCTAVFMLLLDITVVSVALPATAQHQAQRPAGPKTTPP